MKAIILAAGVGSRLKPYTDNTPKSLLEVSGKTILERMLQNIINVGITEVAVVTGYMSDVLESYIKQNFPNLNVSFIHNDKYEITNTGYSLNLTKDFVGGDSFIKFDADVVFEESILKDLIKNSNQTMLVIDKNIHLDKEEVKVILGPENKVLKVGKKVGASLAQGESIGIEKIGATAGDVLFKELDNLLKDQANWQEYYDDSYTTLVKMSVPFFALDITDRKWVEIDTHEDFARAQDLFAE